MNALDYARDGAAAKQAVITEAEELATAVAGPTLDLFHGVDGIRRAGLRLYKAHPDPAKPDQEIASITVSGGKTVRYWVRHGDAPQGVLPFGHGSGDLNESGDFTPETFGKAMARHVKPMPEPVPKFEVGQRVRCAAKSGGIAGCWTTVRACKPFDGKYEYLLQGSESYVPEADLEAEPFGPPPFKAGDLVTPGRLFKEPVLTVRDCAFVHGGWQVICDDGMKYPAEDLFPAEPPFKVGDRVQSGGADVYTVASVAVVGGYWMVGLEGKESLYRAKDLRLEAEPIPVQFVALGDGVINGPTALTAGNTVIGEAAGKATTTGGPSGPFGPPPFKKGDLVRRRDDPSPRAHKIADCFDDRGQWCVRFEGFAAAISASLCEPVPAPAGEQADLAAPVAKWQARDIPLFAPFYRYDVVRLKPAFATREIDWMPPMLADVMMAGCYEVLRCKEEVAGWSVYVALPDSRVGVVDYRKLEKA